MKKNPKNKAVDAEMTTIRMPVSLKRSLQEQAQKEKRALSNYLVFVLEAHVSAIQAQQSEQAAA